MDVIYANNRLSNKIKKYGIFRNSDDVVSQIDWSSYNYFYHFHTFIIVFTLSLSTDISFM